MEQEVWTCTIHIPRRNSLFTKVEVLQLEIMDICHQLRKEGKKDMNMQKTCILIGYHLCYQTNPLNSFLKKGGELLTPTATGFSD